MVSTGFGYGERENIAVAYAKMYAPKRMNESCKGNKCGKRKIRGVLESDDSESKEYPEHELDVAAAGVAGLGGENYDDVTNTVPFQVTKTKMNLGADVNKYDAFDGSVNTPKFKGNRKNLYAKYKNMDELDKAAAETSGIYGLDYDMATNTVPYQVAKVKYDAYANRDHLNDKEREKDIEKINSASDEAMRAIRSQMNKESKRETGIGESCGNCDCVSKNTLRKLPKKHRVPSKTGSKLGVRKVLPFDKRDVKSSVSKFAPKVRKVSESVRHYCISDGDATLCTNDIGESYFNKRGIVGDTRIYESRISAMKDIKKIKSRRNPNSKYKVRACECIGESYQFVDNGHMVNEGLWDGLKSIGSGIVDATKAVGNTVGGVAKGAGNLLQGNFSQAGSDVLGGLKDAGGNLADAGKNIVGGAADATLGTASDVAGAAGGVVKAAGNALGGDFKQAGEELKGASSQALGAVADDAREVDVGGAVGNAAKTAGGAVLDGVNAVANGAGSALKATGNAAQGNFKQAGQELGLGGNPNQQNQPQQSEPNPFEEYNKRMAAEKQNGQQQQTTQLKPPTPEQEAAMKAGKGPLSEEAAANNAQKPQQIPGVQSALPQNVQNAMNTGSQQGGSNGLVAQVGQQQQSSSGDTAVRKTQIQQQIAALQKELQSL